MELIQFMPVAIAVIRKDTQKVVATNLRWETLFAINPSEHVMQPAQALSCWTGPAQWETINNHFQSIQSNALESHEIMLQRKNGAQLLGSMSVMFHREGNPQMLIIAVEDITRRHAAEVTLHKLAYEDLLSGLANRASLHKNIPKNFEQLHKHGTHFALLLLDLDGFKAINDNYGHDAGDEVLRVIGQRLLTLKRSNDMSARLGGDEFCIVLNNCSLEEASDMAMRIINSIAQSIKLSNGIQCNVGVSIGIAHSNSNAIDTETLIKQADLGLYEAKHAGKACWRMHQNKVE